MDEFWKILSGVIGTGGLVTMVAAFLRYRLSRGSQVIGLHRADLQAHGLILDRQEKRVTELERQNRECVEHHLKCLEQNSVMQGELGALREAVRRVDAAASSAVAVVMANAEGVIVSWNEGAVSLFHWTAEEAIGRPITSLTPERYKRRLLKVWREMVDSQSEPNEEVVRSLSAVTREGREISVSLTLSGWPNGKGWVYCAEISRA